MIVPTCVRCGGGVEGEDEESGQKQKAIRKVRNTRLKTRRALGPSPGEGEKKRFQMVNEAQRTSGVCEEPPLHSFFFFSGVFFS